MRGAASRPTPGTRVPSPQCAPTRAGCLARELRARLRCLRHELRGLREDQGRDELAFGLAATRLTMRTGGANEASGCFWKGVSPGSLSQSRRAVPPCSALAGSWRHDGVVVALPVRREVEAQGVHDEPHAGHADLLRPHDGREHLPKSVLRGKRATSPLESKVLRMEMKTSKSSQHQTNGTRICKSRSRTLHLQI